MATLTIAGCGTVTVSGIQNSIDCTGVTVTFATNVAPIFSSRNCNQAGCHTGASPAGGLDLGATDTTAIYNSIIGNGAVDTSTSPSDPLNAPLIAKPLKGLTDHEGGDNFDDLDDADLKTIYCWIQSGANNN